jgi:hypothetical protein
VERNNFRSTFNLNNAFAQRSTLMKSPSPKPHDSHPAEVAPWHRWCLGAAIAMEAAWVVVLAVLAILR